MKDQWIRDMCRLLDGYKKNPPDDLLNDVKQEMRKRNLMPGSKTKRSVRIVPLWIVRSVAAVAVAVVIGLLFYYIPIAREETEIQTAQKSSQSSHRNTPSALQKVRTESKLDINQGTTDKIVASVRRGLNVYPSRNGNDALRTISSSGLLAKVDQREVGTVSSSGSSANVSSVNSGSHGNSTDSQVLPSSGQNRQYSDSYQRNKKKEKVFQEHSNHLFPSVRHHQNRHISIGPFCSGAMGEEAGSGGQGLVMADVAPYEPSDRKMYSSANSIVYGVDKLHTETHYDRPVKLGLSLGYPLTKDLSLHAGVTYSLLSSDETRSNSTEKYKTHQKLHYVGVQLSASQSIWRKKCFNVYVTAGGGVDKMVSGKANTKYYLNDGLVSTTIDDVKMHQLQWSVKGAAGVEYDFIPHVSLYVEPGFSYYFKNGSQLHTYYRDKPLRPSLSIGLRFNIRDVGK